MGSVFVSCWTLSVQYQGLCAELCGILGGNVNLCTHDIQTFPRPTVRVISDKYCSGLQILSSGKTQLKNVQLQIKFRSV